MATNLPRANDLTATWTFVEPGLKLIIGGTGSNDTGVTPQMYMNVYSAIYNYCVNKSRTPQNLGSSNAASQSSLLVGGEIYKKLDGYLQKYVESLHKQPNESFLEFYVRRWTRYTVGAGYLNHVFDYMNRYWVQKERSDGRKDIYDVNTLSLLTWKNHLFAPNVEALIAEILEQIKLQRENQVVDTRLLSSAIRSFVLLGIDTQDLKKPNLNVYIDNFETPFLEATKQFYTTESAEYLASHNVVDYMRKAEQRINEEESRETLYLDEHSKKPLTDALNDTLIVAHAQIMYNEFTNLLDQNQIDHISKMFNLFNRVPYTLEPMAKIFSSYVENQGLKAIENLQNDLASSVQQDKRPKQAIDPKLYIKSLIQVYKTFQDIVAIAFQRSPIFVKALDSACRSYINNNPIAKPTNSKATSKTPELLARYSDTLLKKSKDADAASDMSVDDIMTVFKFLTDKDAFETHYRRLLAKRLIHGTSASDEGEESIIQRLQTENSMEYTSKMTKMFQDVRNSYDLKMNFKEEVSKLSHEIAKTMVPDFEPYVITETMWPLSYTKTNFQLPNDLLPTYSKLEEIYSTKHNGRVLKWHWTLGRGEIRANLSKPGKAPFTFTVSLHQMAILLPFNDSETYSTQDICELTGLEPSLFAANISPLIKAKLFAQSPPGSENTEKLDTKFTVASEFKSKRLKVSFIPSIKSSEQKQEQDDAEKEINKDREMYLKACIVRIMKARKQLVHNTLISEVVQQSHQRFTAKIADIKRCIDYLIEKEYLRRNEDQSYDYLA